jgi:GNAT superfamily N-acetyltransferase
MLVVSSILYEATDVVVKNALLEECALLFSNHYGKWRVSGKNVKLTRSKLLSDYFFDNTCRLHIARFDGKCIGYAISKHFNLTFDDGQVETCDWITQLVVHSEFRGYGIGKRLCFQALNSKSFACGIVSSNPYAVRCLEDVTKKYCDRDLTIYHYDKLVGNSNISYIQNRPLVTTVQPEGCVHGESCCQVDTQFDVDNTGNIHKLETLICKDGLRRWSLGRVLNTGHEFVAFSFRESSLNRPNRCGRLVFDGSVRDTIGFDESDESIISSLQHDEVRLTQFSEFVDNWADSVDIRFKNTYLRFTRLHDQIRKCLVNMLTMGGTLPYFNDIEIHDDEPTSFRATLYWEK